MWARRRNHCSSSLQLPTGRVPFVTARSAAHWAVALLTGGPGAGLQEWPRQSDSPTAAPGQEALSALPSEVVVISSADLPVADGVVAASQTHPELGPGAGLGAALWVALQTTGSEILVVVDVDRSGLPDVAEAAALAERLTSPDVQLALGGAPRRGATTAAAPDGELPCDALTDLVLAPSLAIHHPHLAWLADPRPALWAVRREHLEMLPIPVGVGAEVAVLLDTDLMYGSDSIVEVPIGEGSPATACPGRPAATQHDATQLHVVLERRLPQRLPVSEEPVTLGPSTIRVDECPPTAALAGYRDAVVARANALRADSASPGSLQRHGE